ncbi:DExH-box ATP-dependent RNA helicase DExH3-like, partial [Nilaparvata lugens]|uniref:DExH-box ATP-dependent RNA helicase DExH3-like n=1 Tax=Nilaparvata lugens TaxID=108931 RepID=UPI00193E22F2
LGNVVGYQVRMGSVLPRFNDGYIILCTLGVMLRKLLSPDGMRGITHLIIDEAHERDLNTDILLLLSKRAIKNNPDLRIVIMSATINPELFQNYFNNAPSLLVPGFTHPVTSRFLDPDIDSRVIAKAVHWVAANRPPGAILVFLPGWDTISKVRDELEGHPRLAVLPVHSRLSHDDQRRIFQRPPAGRRKVVLATNIAETSITINDVVYVIDSGLLKEKRLNSRDGMSCLDNHWASKASVIQRKGRAGRVQPGECYHLYSQHKFDSLDEFPMPEVHRIRLEMVVLQSKTYSGHEEAEQFLRQLPEPPSVSVIREAVKTLQFMGALDMEENLTALGHRISVFTTHPLISKALVYSYFFKCVNPLITIAPSCHPREIYSRGWAWTRVS